MTFLVFSELYYSVMVMEFSFWDFLGDLGVPLYFTEFASSKVLGFGRKRDAQNQDSLEVCLFARISVIPIPLFFFFQTGFLFYYHWNP